MPRLSDSGMLRLSGSARPHRAVDVAISAQSAPSGKPRPIDAATARDIRSTHDATARHPFADGEAPTLQPPTLSGMPWLSDSGMLRLSASPHSLSAMNVAIPALVPPSARPRPEDAATARHVRWTDDATARYVCLTDDATTTFPHDLKGFLASVIPLSNTDPSSVTLDSLFPTLANKSFSDIVSLSSIYRRRDALAIAASAAQSQYDIDPPSVLIDRAIEP